jgi:8-oxo-dGTP diphosphatase
VQEDDLKVLLIRRDLEPFKGWWAIPGGRLGRGERLDDAAARKLVEETGVGDVYLEQLYTFGELDRATPGGSLAIGYFALVDSNSVKLPKREDWPTAWFSMNDLPELAFDNSAVLKYALRRLRYKMEYTNVAYSLLPRYFTRPTAGCLRIDRRPQAGQAHRKRILALGIVSATEKALRRPLPAIYEFFLPAAGGLVLLAKVATNQLLTEVDSW